MFFVSSGSKIKFLVGALVGVVLMSLLDLNEMFLRLEDHQQFPPPSAFAAPVVVRQETPQSKAPDEPVAAASEAAAENPFLGMMKQNPLLYKSGIQLSSFWSKKDSLGLLFERSYRFDVDPGEYGATVVSDQWAFLHIWANGGDRTVIQVAADQLNEVQQPKDFSAIQNRRWMALVRDPIQHFLEGWAMAEIKVMEEFVNKGHNDMASFIKAEWESPEKTFDERVSSFLDRVQAFSRRSATIYQNPLMHALPQSNFLMNDVGAIHSNLAFIADASEWEAVMEFVGFQGDIQKTGLDRESTLRMKYFPTEVTRLSRSTLVKLCEFLAVDYYLFRYDAPSACLNKDGPLDFPHRLRKLQESSSSSSLE